MADTTKHKAAKPRGSTLDRAMAGFLAGAVAFAAMAMPGDILAGLIGATGLPSLVPAARPPLGDTARLLIAFAGALATFLTVSALLRALNKPAQGRARKPAEVTSEPPRLRRADAHPDAPSRSPILAGRELGLPLDEVPIEERVPADLAEVENVDFEAEWERPLPGFIDEEARPAEADLVDWEPVEEDAAPSENVPAEALAEDKDQVAEAEPAPVGSSPTLSEIPFWMPEGQVAEASVAEEPEPPVTAVEMEEPAPEPEPPLTVPFRKSRAHLVSEAETQSLDSMSERLPESAAQNDSIDNLVERFETGLGQRARPSSRRSGEGELDKRLRSALGDLKKMSGRR